MVYVCVHGIGMEGELLEMVLVCGLFFFHLVVRLLLLGFLLD